ncbi:hypothetical protein Tco_0768964 [Tanacetum coccineum]|uniref:Retrotransposon gag domain-containing protein n=1 Tax=Tanacetum coccineum TaxID=301880 RepID=A0ABQ4ZBN4_9ASTR
MAAPFISISLGLSDESMGSSIPRVILFGSIPIELDTHSSSEYGPSKGSLPHVPVAPMVSHFLCSNDSESDTELPERHVSSTPHDAMVARWRSRVASRPSSPSGSSSPTTSTSEIPTAPILLASPAIDDIPVGRLYRTYPGGPCRALTARKTVVPLPSHRLVLRLWLWSPMSNTHFSSTVESSTFDSLATILDRHSHLPSHFAGPSHKMCRSLATTVHLPIHTSGALVPTHGDLLPPRKRFMDLISPKDSVEEDIDADVLVDIEADVAAAKAMVDMDVEVGIDVGIGIEVDVEVNREDEDEEAEYSDRGTIEVGVDVVTGIDIPDGMRIPNAIEHLGQVGEVMQDIYRHSVRVDRFRRRMGYMEDELRQSHRFRYYERLRFKRLEAFAVRHLDHDYHSLCQNGKDGDNGNGGGNRDRNGGGNGNGNRKGNGNGNPNKNDRGAMSIAHERACHDFVKCQPLNFKGIERVIELTRWFENMETIFHISNCPKKYQVKYATCTLLNNALTWWNLHKRTIEADVASAMSWRELMRLMTKGNVIASEPTRLQDAIWIANNLMDQKLKGYAARCVENKRRLDNS